MKNDVIKSLYIHIPFCNNICSYCDFCKFYYNEEIVNKYLDGLEKEIKERYKGEILDTIYIGGGTPSSLNLVQLTKLFNILKIINKSSTLEFTIECNISDIEEDKLKLFKEKGVNRLSIGVESFQESILTYLERNNTRDEIKEKLKLAKEYFNNINIDLIYAVLGETQEMLKDDIKCFLELDVEHISTYSLIIEDHTKLGIKNTEAIDEELDRKMFDTIHNILTSSGYSHYEVSNFSKNGFESRHNLTYWNNHRYYGFGLSASGYIDNIRYTNTKNINKYLLGNYVSEEEIVSKETLASNYAILGLRTIYGVNKKEFYDCFGIDFVDYFKVDNLLKDNILLEDKEKYYINPKYWYVMNEILVNFI